MILIKLIIIIWALSFCAVVIIGILGVNDIIPVLDPDYNEIIDKIFHYAIVITIGFPLIFLCILVFSLIT